MKNKRSNNSGSQQNSGGKKRFKRIRRRGKGKKNKNNFDNSSAAATPANTPRKFKNNNQKMNRPLKRLNRNHNNNKNNQVHTRNMVKPKPNFLQALAEYKRVRNFSHEEQPSTSKENQENVKSFGRHYQSVTVISDDDLEDGEIIEQDKVTQYASLIAESFTEIERSKNICDKKSPNLPKNVNEPLFYVDKSAEGGNSEVPLYISLSESGETMETDDSVIFVDEDQEEDSVIIIDDNPIAESTLSKESDFIALTPESKAPENTISRKMRQKERLKAYKQKKMVEKVLELQANGLLDGMTVRVPKSAVPSASTSKPAAQASYSSVTKQTPSTSTKVREKRIILIDGSNVAFGFTASVIGKKAMVDKDKEFSAEALNKVITYFEQKEFRVKAIVPEYRVRRDKSSNHELMIEMLDSGKLITTPSKSYDDNILLESAAKLDAAVVSNDLFRDIRNKPEFKTVVENRQIRYNWVFGELILAEDPCGRSGPKLDDILFKSS